MDYYVVTYTHTKMIKWALHLHAHTSYLKEVIQDGNLIISGPLEISKGRAAMLIFREINKDKLDKLIATDPFSEKGLVAEKTVNLWNVTHGNPRTITRYDDGHYYRVTYEIPAAADPASVEVEQSAYLEALVASQALRAAGPYVDDPRQGLLILTAHSAEECSDLVAGMPIVSTLGATTTIRKWKPLFE